MCSCFTGLFITVQDICVGLKLDIYTNIFAYEGTILKGSKEDIFGITWFLDFAVVLILLTAHMSVVLVLLTTYFISVILLTAHMYVVLLLLTTCTFIAVSIANIANNTNFLFQ
jgi:hypothetical protein